MDVRGHNAAAVAGGLIQWNRHTASSIFRRLRSLGPYVLVELILPGGTLIAILLYLYQHKPSLVRSPELAQQASACACCSGGDLPLAFDCP
jgi:hypothetical protein